MVGGRAFVVQGPYGGNGMNWDQVFNTAFRNTVALSGAFISYHVAASYVAMRKTSNKPRTWERIRLFGVCLFTLAVFAGFCSMGTNGDEDHDPVPASATDGGIVFFTLLLPVLFGVQAGFDTDKKTLPEDKSDRSEW